MRPDEIRAQLSEAIRSDSRAAAILKKIAAGRANFSDTMEYSLISGRLTGEQLSDVILEFSEGREELAEALLHDRYEDINARCAEVQTALDDKQGLHLAPQKADFPAERAAKFARSLIDPTVSDETIKRRARNVSENITVTFHDEFIKENVRFRDRAGLKCYVERTTSGGCCDWCSSVAGRYLMQEQPEGLFRRHDNCDCTIVYDGQVLRGQPGENGRRGRRWVEEKPKAEYTPPRKLSRTEADKLRAENLPKRLTNGADSGKINIKEPLSSFLNSSEQLYENAKKIKPLPGYQDIIIHGDKTGFSYKDKDGNETLLNVGEFTKILKESGLYKGGKIRLISCEAAAEGAHTAQWFANDMGVEVLAPTDIVWVDREGNITIGPDEFTDTGTWITVNPETR